MPVVTGYSLSTAPFRTMPPEEVLPRMADAGISVLELHVEENWLDPTKPARQDKLAKLLARYGLQPGSVHTQYGPTADLANRDEAYRREGVRLVAWGARALFEVGGRIAVMHPSIAIPAEQRPAGVAAVRRSLEELLEVSVGWPVTLALENMLPGHAGDCSSELADMMAGFPQRVAFCLDTGHAALAPEGVKLAAPLLDRLVWLHLQDNQGQGDAHMMPFTGHIDWQVVAGLLEQARYRGPYMFELSAAVAEEAVPQLATLAARLDALRQGS